jgi:hypothetical protein
MTDSTPAAPARAPWYASLWDLIASEPVAAQGLVQASLYLGEAFGLHLTGPQMAAIGVFVAAVLSFLLRRSVVPLVKLPSAGGQ